jgi:hypothetical protein
VAGRADRHPAASRQAPPRIADLILVEIPDQATLAARRRADPARRRRNFDLHAQLAEPLRDWYLAVEHLDPPESAGNYQPPAYPTRPSDPAATAPASTCSTHSSASSPPGKGCPKTVAFQRVPADPTKISNYCKCALA